ncbi:hypothetical protein WN55_11209 [Dufourea novaeangliae]|uniref:Uncharacterized protein n=1 Tax=Dufourea novaeangliae TaxID=178035 RepID=A0A154P9Q6_DUFNO|nr:hypothetical protein WN55_11209 [Dufourea novaeangliae]
MADHRPAPRSGRDIRLSTATMRALNSRRPQPTTSTLYLFPRSFHCLLLLLFVVHSGQARSVHRDEEGPLEPEGGKLSAVKTERDVVIVELTSGTTDGKSAPKQVQGKLLGSQNDGVENEGIEPEEPGNIDGTKISQLKIGELLQEAGQSDAEQLAAAKSPRTDTSASSILQELDIEKETAKKIGDRIEDSKVLNKEDDEASVAKKRRRNDVALVGKPEVPSEGIPSERIEEVKDEGIRRFDVQIDAGVVAPSQEGVVDIGVNDADARTVRKITADATEQSQSAKAFLTGVDHQDGNVHIAEEPKGELPGYFRKSGPLDSDQDKDESSLDEGSNSKDEKELNENREYRYLDDSESKSKRKTSTVYLNAEEKKLPDGEQQSIVEGQIKKLISIRDDVLSDAQKADKLDEAKVLNTKREVGADEVVLTQGNIETGQTNKVKDRTLFYSRQSLRSDSSLRKREDQAVSFQDQIRNRTFLVRVKENSTELLPEILKFTENQLLNRLEQIALSKRSEYSNNSYVDDVKDLGLTDKQLRIIECAEQLVIFLYPLLPESPPDKLPIGLNAFDLFQGKKSKTGRAQNLYQIRYIAPDSIVYNILQNVLESYPNEETLVSYVDPTNATLQSLLTSNQLDILQMAEKLLPQALRQEYSDRMFSCVRRFEYFSCVKYFAWPMIKQYFPALPAFPDYEGWYPFVSWTPQYPILPFPTIPGEIGELPEVVDSDVTRQIRPRPEAVMIQVLQNALNEQPQISISPSFLDQSADSYVALIPQDQLLSINMAEQLIPVRYRPEFVQKTVNCMKEYNYLTCMKYSTWPTVRLFVPNLPDISTLFSDLQLPDLSGIYDLIEKIPNFGPLWPFGGTSIRSDIVPTVVQRIGDILQSSNELETKITETLSKVRDSTPKSPEISPFILTGNAITFTRFTGPQLDILRLAESLIPPIARPGLVTEVIVYLQRSDNFIDCARYVIWPTIARYVSDLPEFPSLEAKKEPINTINIQASPPLSQPAIVSTENMQERIVPDTVNKPIIGVRLEANESRNKEQQNPPLISVTDTSFLPIFTEHPENVILNIVRSVQLQAVNLNLKTTPVSSTKNQQFLDLINEQQLNILNIVDSLLPESIRPEFANKLLACLRLNNFLVCTRDVIWPTLSMYFPWLPGFPNFGPIITPPTNGTSTVSVKRNMTESSSVKDAQPLSETDVKTGQHGDTTVTITDTRFFPIYNELPETVIMNILRAVQLSLPNPPSPSVPARIQELANILTDQQINVLNTVENLLPIASRLDYINKIGPCLKDKTFLECTRDIAWPAIGQAYPWLPRFPNFGAYQNMPRIRFQVLVTEKSKGSNIEAQTSQDNSKDDDVWFQENMGNIENFLLRLPVSPMIQQSYLNTSSPDVSQLSERQENLIKLIERVIPDTAREPYISKMLECLKGYNYATCTRTISWPTLKEYIPSLPDLSVVNESRPQSPDIPSLTLEPVPYPAEGAVDAQLDSRLENQGTPAFTPSVGESIVGSELIEVIRVISDPVLIADNDGAVPGYAGQPPGILIDISKEKVQLPDVDQLRSYTKENLKPEEARNRRRRSVELSKTYYETDETFIDPSKSASTFPNITESDYLQLLIQIRQNARSVSSGGEASLESREYFVDTLNTTVRSSLTADQYELLKIVEDVDRASGKGLAQQVIQCVTGLSAIRCLGIFIWPLIISNLPSLGGGLPSLPSLGILGRSLDTENQVQEFFGMSTSEVESEMLERKDSIEHFLLDWYKTVVEEKFQTNVGFLKIRGYGNGELGISFSGFREGRGAKLKDNKNLPSILTIISDIMEEVLDQRPESEKIKKDKEKKERSIDISREGDIQFLKDSEEYVDIKRSMNDDQIITMFLDKIRSNDSETDGDGGKYFDLEDAYNAFGVLFGPRLHSRLAHKLQNFDHRLRSLEEARSSDTKKEVDIVPLESQKESDESKVPPLKTQVAHDFEKESSRDQEERQRQKRAKNFFKSLIEKHPNKYLKDYVEERLQDIKHNKIVDDEQTKEKKSCLIVKLPRLDDEILSRKMTNTIVHLGRAMKNKMTEMMPGIGLALSFLLQMAVAHARAAASMAGMISNMAMGSAVIGMIRDSFFGANNHPQIKYVYDNHKTGPGISWPTSYGSDYNYHGMA